MKNPVDILSAYWGYNAFREKQEEIIQAVLNRQDTLALLPTGGGKSVCYQIPALLQPGVCIVVSPLIALMHDQVDNLKKRGIKAMAITSGMSKKQLDTAFDNIIYGDYKLLYVSPERLKTEMFIARFKKMNVNLIAVDEAHCISQWGYDFRPPYLEISAIRKLKPHVPVLALTATATPQVVQDIQDKLEFKTNHVIQKSFYRSNLIYSTILTVNKKNRIEEYLHQHAGCGIIYCSTRKAVKELALHLIHKNFVVDFYHAGLDHPTRRQKQEDWVTEKTRVIISTNAFGMGIDKSNVRFVLHYDIPETMEAYFQEAGRAGRDEKPAEAVMFFEEEDIHQLIEKVNTKYPPIERIKQIYNALGNHLQIAFGSGKNNKYPIEINDFCNKYGLQLMETYNAFKFLELAGYLEFSEGIYVPPKLKLTAPQLEVYKEQIKDEKINRVIQFLLRSHIGLFDDYLNINEYIIAQKTGLTKTEVIEKLTYLTRLELADYVPQTSEPHVTFMTERLPDTHLSISPTFYHHRKELAFEKMKAIIHYLQSTTCRSVELLNYFGDINSMPCGQCSACRAENHDVKTVNLAKRILLFIHEKPHDKEHHTTEILTSFSNASRDEVLQSLRWLADHKYIRMADTGKVFILLNKH